MKTTLDLPDDLVREIKLRAVREDRNVKDLAAELLRAGLQTTRIRPAARATLDIDAKGVPRIVCAASARASKMSVEQLLALETATLAREDHERV